METAFRDTKQHFGFDTYQVKYPKSINRFVQLSFVAGCITQLLFNVAATTDAAITIEQVCRELGIDWYRPKKLTRGLMAKYLRTLIDGRLFSATIDKNTNSHDIQLNLDNIE